MLVIERKKEEDTYSPYWPGFDQNYLKMTSLHLHQIESQALKLGCAARLLHHTVPAQPATYKIQFSTYMIEYKCLSQNLNLIVNIIISFYTSDIKKGRQSNIEHHV